MNKILLIIRREYITRVRKRSFILMTLLGPLISGVVLIAPIWLASKEDSQAKVVAVSEYDLYDQPLPDSLQIFRNVIPSNQNIRFSYLSNVSYRDIPKILKNSNYDGILVINQRLLNEHNGSVEFFAKRELSLGLQSYVTNNLESYIYNQKLLHINIRPETINALKTNLTLVTKKLKNGEFEKQGLTDIRILVGNITGFLIYFFLFFFSAQVMRGVVEEKTNRIIEVIITSVKPIQLMMGKIIGIGLVGLTQFMAWVILSASIFYSVQGYTVQHKLAEQKKLEVPTELFSPQPAHADVPSLDKLESEISVSAVWNVLHDINFGLILVTFLFYFIGGYLLYSSLFAAVGSAVDSETDTQQFMLPVMIPLIVSVIVLVNTITNPGGNLAYWFSIIPLTSPVIMMARIPFGVPPGDLWLSMSLLVASFILMTWLSSKIYRVGILMYGKKPSYRELLKWLTYKD